MDATAIRIRLNDREKQLLDDLASYEQEAELLEATGSSEQTPGSPTREWRPDEVEVLREIAGATQELEDVRTALVRLDDNTYGQCVECGKPIPPGRLLELPWALYCAEHQRIHDSALGEGHSLTL